MADDKSRAEEMLSTSDVGRMLGVTSKTVIRMIENGQLPGYKVNFVWRVKRSDVEDYLQAHKFRPEQRQSDD